MIDNTTGLQCLYAITRISKTIQRQYSCSYKPKQAMERKKETGNVNINVCINQYKRSNSLIDNIDLYVQQRLQTLLM